ncbi:Tat pathway signal sequence, partial [Actinomyces sp. MRS3W]|nr:Tat pathway signal sequence [Actinomyces sp. MRS3W]
VRIVVEDADDAEEIAAWRNTIAALQAAGCLVVVQLCDSAYLADFDTETWDARVRLFLATFPEADAWEIGNELGGSWAGEDAVDKTLRAARAVRSNPATKAATTLLTLYYQLGQDDAAHSLFTWAQHELDEALRELTDVIGLSVYPQWHPLGAAADRVLTTLASTFPGKLLALTELGYGADDLNDGPWWFGSETDMESGRTAVATHLTSVALGRPQAWGAPFWWYYLEDEAPGAPGGPVSPALAQAAATR